MADGHHLKKKWQTYISATFPTISTTFCMLMNIRPPKPKRCSKDQFFKIQDGGWQPFWKLLCDIRATVPPILIKFSITMHNSHHNLTGNQMFENLKIQDGGRWPSWILWYVQNRLGDFDEIFARLHIFVIKSLPAV